MDQVSLIHTVIVSNKK
jgi:hypothetical protein